MADAPKVDSGGGFGFIEITVGIFILLALLSGGLKGDTSSNQATDANGNQIANTNTLTSTIDAKSSCAIALNSPVAFQFVGEKYMKVQGTLNTCVTNDTQTAFFLQVFDTNNVPVSDYIPVGIVENKGDQIIFNTTISFLNTPRTKKGTAVFTPNVQGVTTSQAVRVPVVFRK